MKLKRLYIGDMGIYRNALIDNIGSKIVVIGGLNRSGKTTLLEALRHMPYGLPKGLREVKSEYFVEADFTDEQNAKYTVKLGGLKEPQISSEDNNVVSSKPIYGSIDKYTYSQLYTISLDELKKSNVKSEEEKLQSVLLGAGLKDIVHIPKLVEEFRKEKEKLGGKQGNPSTKVFKPYYDKLLEGINNREEALKQLDEYESKCSELKGIEKQIENSSKMLDAFNQEVMVLEVVKLYYNQQEEKRTLQLQLNEIYSKNITGFSQGFPSLEKVQSLYEEYREANRQYEKLREEFESRVSPLKGFYERLLMVKEQLRGFEKQLSGLMEKIDNYKSARASYDRDRQQLQGRMNALNSSLKEDFLKVINIDCDSIEQDKLVSLVEEYNNSEAEQKQCERELVSLKLQKEMLDKEIKGLKVSEVGNIVGKYLYISIGIIFAGLLLFFFSKLLGGAMALVGVVAVSFYFLLSNTSQTQLQARKNSAILQQKALEDRLKQQEDSTKRIKNEINILKDKLNIYRKKLELQKEVSPIGLLQYFKDIKDLKKDILKLGYSGNALDKLKQEISTELIKANDLVSSFEGEQVFDERNIFNHSKELCNKLEVLSEQLSYAERLNISQGRLAQLGKKLSTLLNINSDNVIIEELDNIIIQYKMYNRYKEIKEKIENIDRLLIGILQNERIKKSFAFVCEEYNINEDSEILALNKLFESFNSEDQLERQMVRVSAKFQENYKKLEELREQKQILSNEIKAFSTSEKLIDSQREIDEQRSVLKQLATKYAVYGAAEFILESVQKNFIATAKETILGGAGSIFNKITGDEYKALLPGDNLLQADFKAILKDGQVQDSVSILSRGTGEQLYLSVRLNRIKEIKEKLPLILDDPFVNFDSFHIKNTLKVISDIAEHNQVFILTCHSELIELISEISSEVQYWKLKKGSFELSSSKELIEYLL